MISAIIIDDEAKGRTALREKIITYCPQVVLVAEASSGRDAIIQIQQLKPRLIFLDIKMPRMNGFEMLNALTEKTFHIIFTTAYDQYAIRAIKYAAFDYLLKPVDIEELKTAVAKIEEHENSQTKKQVELLQQNLQEPQRQLSKLAIPTVNGLFFYNIADIIYLEAASNYTNIYLTSNAKVTATKTLKDFEELLPAQSFFRSHHSYLINLNFIKRYIRGDGGQIELQNGAYVEVSRRKKEAFLKMIGQ